MLHQHKHITRWRLAFQDNGEPLSTINSKRGLLATQQNHQTSLPVFTNENKLVKNSQKFNSSYNNFLFSETTNFIQYRNYSSQGRRPGFFSQFFDNIKQEMAKNKEMKENLRKFREEAEKLEQSDALKKARAKYMTVENEASAIKAKFEKVKSTVSGVLEDASKSDIAKKAGKISEELGKTARDAAESLSAKSQKLGATDTFKTISDATAAVREELESTGSHARVYVAPLKLRKRQEMPVGDARVFTANTDTMDVEIHKDSRFYESWQNFKNNNPYVNKILDWKMKYEESENPVIRVSRIFTDKVTNIVGGIFQNTELSEVLTEIVKIDPGFTKTKFLRQCETDIIPNILEAIMRGDLEILKDWCHEGPYNLLSRPILEVRKKGGRFESKVLDIEGLDLHMGKIMDQNPVLIIHFTAQQIVCVRNKNNEVIEGDPDKVYRVEYVWALSRDKSVLDPKAAWRLLDISATSAHQFV